MCRVSSDAILVAPVIALVTPNPSNSLKTWLAAKWHVAHFINLHIIWVSVQENARFNVTLIDKNLFRMKTVGNTGIYFTTYFFSLSLQQSLE